MKITLTRTELAYLSDKLAEAKRLNETADAVVTRALATIGADRAIEIPADKARLVKGALEWDDAPKGKPAPAPTCVTDELVVNPEPVAAGV